jgi:hypothetical protein
VPGSWALSVPWLQHWEPATTGANLKQWSQSLWVSSVPWGSAAVVLCSAGRGFPEMVVADLH